MRLKAWVNKIWPAYAFWPTVAVFTLNTLAYTVSKLFNQNFTHYDLSISLDSKIPFVPWFVIFYVIAYAQWAWNYFFHARAGREEFYHIIITDLMAKMVCLIFFTVMPTVMVRPEITGNTLWDWGLKIIYFVDTPTNLFPSVHCLASWLAFRASLLMKNMPKWYPVCQLIISLLVFASTVLIKQHLFLDTISGVLLVEICWFIARRFSLWRIVKIFETKEIRAQFSQKEEEGKC